LVGGRISGAVAAARGHEQCIADGCACRSVQYTLVDMSSLLLEKESNAPKWKELTAKANGKSKTRKPN
jgi:hypothetical protein